MAQVLCIFNVSSSCTKTGMRCCLQLGGMVAQLLAKSRLVDPKPVGDPAGCRITRGWVVAAPERCSPARTVGRSEGWEFPGVGFRLLDESDSSRALLLGDIPTRGHRGIVRGGSEGSTDGAWAMGVRWHGCESSLVPCRAARRRARGFGVAVGCEVLGAALVCKSFQLFCPCTTSSASSVRVRGDAGTCCRSCAVERWLVLPQPLPCPDKPPRHLLHEVHLS